MEAAATAYNQNHTIPPVFTFTEGERQIFKPKEKITVSGWVEKHRYVTKGPKKGLWTNDYTPYTVEPMDCWNQPHIRKVILCWAPQTAKTQVALNCLGYTIDQDPDDFMYVMCDEKTARRKSRSTIIPMLRTSPRLSNLLSPWADDTSTLEVRFRNGMELMLGWATSARVLASESIKNIVFDETNKYPPYVGDEPDPISIGEMRTNAYPDTAKIMYLSTPTVAGGIITRAMEFEADEIRYYHVPCPFCNELQIMEFENIVWPENIRDHRIILRKKLATYTCVRCGMKWNDIAKNHAVRKGRWIAKDPVDRPLAVAFHLPAWYSPLVSLSKVAAAYLQGKNDLEKHRTFITQYKAEAWEEKVETKKEGEILKLKTDIPPGVVPPGAVALTVGIDVQKSGFWFLVRAWAKDLTSWLVQYGYLSSWEDIKSLIFFTRYPVQDTENTMGIWRAAMDTGGSEGEEEDKEWSRTQEIYRWLRKNSRGTVFGIKGSSKPLINHIQYRKLDKHTSGSRKRIPGGIDLRIIDTAYFKDTINFRMKQTDGFEQRFYLHSDTGIDYARQILAEEKHVDRKGKVTWKQVRRDNHLLDCEVYAAACADSAWYPSLSYLTRNVDEGQTDKPKKKKQGVVKSKWMS